METLPTDHGPVNTGQTRQVGVNLYSPPSSALAELESLIREQEGRTVALVGGAVEMIRRAKASQHAVGALLLRAREEQAEEIKAAGGWLAFLHRAGIAERTAQRRMALARGDREEAARIEAAERALAERPAAPSGATTPAPPRRAAPPTAELADTAAPAVPVAGTVEADPDPPPAPAPTRRTMRDKYSAAMNELAATRAREADLEQQIEALQQQVAVLEAEATGSGGAITELRALQEQVKTALQQVAEWMQRHKDARAEVKALQRKLDGR